jgi:hypothetical protein
MDRQQAHDLLDRLGPAQFSAVAQLLEILAAPHPLFESMADAPLDDESLNTETSQTLARSRDSLARSEGIPHEEILREFGLGR